MNEELKAFANMVYKMRSAQERYTYLVCKSSCVEDLQNAQSVLKIAKAFEQEVDLRVTEIINRKANVKS